MKNFELFIKPMLFAFLLASFSGFSQVTEQWIERYNGSGNASDDARAVAVDGAGNVYVTGTSYGNETLNDFATIKYNAAGAVVWARRYDSPLHGNDGASDVTVDGAGNVYVTGSSDGKTSEFGFDDHQMTTIKYDAAGNELWVRHYDTNDDDNDGSDGAVAVAVDATGNVYVTGYNGVWAAYTTIKYNAAGNQLWVRSYGNVAGNAYVSALVVDGSGNVYITGSRNKNGYSEPIYATVKYNTNGIQLWARTYDNEDEYNDEATDLAVDGSGNVYVTGNTATIKYSASGNQLWVRNNVARSLAVDGSGNAYVTGGGATTKYDADGNQLWKRTHNITSDITSGAKSTAVDGSGNVYVTGGNGTYPDRNYATIKYDTNGNELWMKTYNGPESSYDAATSLALDASGNAYVTGSSVGKGTGSDYATIKYSQTQAAQKVSSLSLINADSDAAIRELKDGDTINLAALPSLNLNIRANTNPGVVGSVVFSLSGAETRNHTENIVPYALFADSNRSNYYDWTPQNGNYTLTATPYSGSKGSGVKGMPLTIYFTVTGQVVNNLILVNAETDKDIKTLVNGDVIDLAALPTRNLNIRAVVHPDTVGSVVFNLNNKVIVRENLAPYAIGGDIKGDYRAWTLPTGKHTLTATPYALKNGTGEKGTAHSVTFTVVDMSETAWAVNAQKAIIDAGRGAGASIKATPNPFATHTTITFSMLKAGYTTVQVFDMKGILVERLFEAHAEAGKTYQVPLNSKGLTSGMYMVKLVTDKQVQFYKLVSIR
jgi:hypothetical protein